jgi:hypothetical protein
MPSLADLGWSTLRIARDPLVPAGQDMARGEYQKPGPPLKMVVIRIYVPGSEEEARTIFGSVREAYRVVPLQALIQDDPTTLAPGQAGAPANRAGEPLAIGDEQAAYITARNDSQGNSVWTDVYRFGDAVAVIQLLESGATDQSSLRRDIARRIEANLGN